MTIADIEIHADRSRGADAPHPLASLTAAEFERIRDIVTAAPDFIRETFLSIPGAIG